MSSTLQNRLIGTIIVVALIVILLPELLDGEKSTNLQEFVNVPPSADSIDVTSDGDIDTQAIEAEVTVPVEIVNETALDENDEQTDLGAVTVNDTASADTDAADTATTSASMPDTASPNTTVANTTVANTTSATASRPTTVNVSDAPQPQDTASVSTADEVLDAGWVVQLGSFRHEKNVQELLKTLENAGYRAYSTPITTSAGKLNKVFVGPELDRERLENALVHLNELTKLKGKITAFEVSAK